MRYYNIFKSFVFILSLLMLNNMVIAQDEEPAYDGYETRISLEYIKKSDGLKTLSCVLNAKKGDINLPVENAEIKFLAGSEQTVELGSKKTDYTGLATLDIKDDVKLPANDTGAVLFKVQYKGLANSKDAEAELLVVDVNLELTLEEVDSVKTISVKATKIGKNNEVVPLAGQEVVVYVKRLYSNLKIGTITLDDAGTGSTAYSVVPGDSAGNVVIIAKIEGSEVYANVEKGQQINWGTKVSYDVATIKRALWTNEAPLWMAITLSIFLIGVWYHLVRVFIKMRKIKKMGEEVEKMPQI